MEGSTPSLPQQIQNLHLSLSRMVSEVKPFESFYEEAEARNQAMVKNLLASPLPAGGEGAHAAVLVVGGYHTPGITSLLKAQGIPYLVLAPKITKVEGDPSAYLSVFAREKTPLEKLFEGRRLSVVEAAWVPSTNINNLPIDPTQLGRLKATFFDLWWKVLSSLLPIRDTARFERAAAFGNQADLGKLDPQSFVNKNPLVIEIGTLDLSGEVRKGNLRRDSARASQSVLQGTNSGFERRRSLVDVNPLAQLFDLFFQTVHSLVQPSIKPVYLVIQPPYVSE